MTTTFHESLPTKHPGWAKPIRELGIQIAGTKIEPVLEKFRVELQAVGINRIKPRFYLSDEWGVAFGTTAIAIPFYLAQPELQTLHEEQVGFLEGSDHLNLLRYLRHEMGHVVNYAYQLYNRPDWIEQFGAIDQPYQEEYRPEPFSRRFVRHLPGWYAQKHPDEDWAETFAVWMTPGMDWHQEYADWPGALAKLVYCQRIMTELTDRDPVTADGALDQSVEDLAYSLEDYYRVHSVLDEDLPPGLDGSLRAIFEDLGEEEEDLPQRPAGQLIARLERQLMASVFRWTGHFPERTRSLLRFLIRRADDLKLVYPEKKEMSAATALTTFVTALAMNHVQRGSYAS